MMSRHGFNRSPGFWERQSQTILVTGAHTPIGRRIVERLAYSGWGVRVFTPNRYLASPKPNRRIFEVEGSLSSISDITAALQDCNRVLHLAECSLSRNPEDYRIQNVEYTRNLTQACKKVGISQFVFLSSASVNLRRLNRYSRSKKTAEDVIRGSGLPWVILRPSLIVGQDGSEAYRWLRMAIRRFLWIPLPEGGHAIKRPIHEDDVARAIDMLFLSPPTNVARHTYHLSGLKAYTSAEIIDLIAQEHHLPRRKIIGLPNWLCLAGARISDFLLNIPFEISEALLTLVQDADHDSEKAFHDFHFQPSPLDGRLTHSSQPSHPGEHTVITSLQRTSRRQSLLRGNRK